MIAGCTASIFFSTLVQAPRDEGMKDYTTLMMIHLLTTVVPDGVVKVAVARAFPVSYPTPTMLAPTERDCPSHTTG
jgi:hypothetical protein